MSNHEAPHPKQGTGILALDIGTATGWAWASQSKMDYGLQSFPKRTGEHQGHRFRRMISFMAGDLAETIPGGIQAIYFEDVMFHASQDARHLYFGFRACIEMLCAKHDWACSPVSVPQWQKHLTGCGKPGKERILECVQRIGYNISPKQQDIADALGILKFGLEIDYKTRLCRFSKEAK